MRAATSDLPALLPPCCRSWRCSPFCIDGVFFGATRTAELRNGMLLRCPQLPAAAWSLLGRALGNHGLWLAFLAFLGARGVILALIYRRADGAVAFARG